MKINKIVVSYSRTIQMRQYEPVSLTGTVEAQIDPGDKVEQEFIRVRNIARKQIDDEIKRLKVERKESFLDEHSDEKVI